MDSWGESWELLLNQRRDLFFQNLGGEHRDVFQSDLSMPVDEKSLRDSADAVIHRRLEIRIEEDRRGLAVLSDERLCGLGRVLIKDGIKFHARMVPGFNGVADQPVFGRTGAAPGRP